MAKSKKLVVVENFQAVTTSLNKVVSLLAAEK